MTIIKHDFNVPGWCPECNATRMKRRRNDRVLYCAACGEDCSDADYREHQRRKNGVKKAPLAGLSQRIRDALRVQRKMTSVGIANYLGVDVRKVRCACHVMVTRTGGISVVPGSKPPIYQLPDARPGDPEPDGFKLARPISVGRGFRWGVASW